MGDTHIHANMGSQGDLRELGLEVSDAIYRCLSYSNLGLQHVLAPCVARVGTWYVNEHPLLGTQGMELNLTNKH